ncbi:DUF1330 domain-containing protein [Shewanella atlantica]|uniref:DUF1330 domain-containing protein n=1 Tax=Shewanella atlantica TaxID=271099 RepID=A0A3S0IWX4_9GAMM|nr:DUF1330 domain-containing protein [Shewanella atlantica]RTR33197.1 DUF1330 domain-containing protein [Shewanella atlantica]
MKCYVITNYSVDQNKLDEYLEYTKKATEITTKFGGRLLVASQENQVVEGHPENIIAVIEFDSKEQAQMWYTSEEYTAIKDLRTKVTIAGWLIFSDEFKL